MPLGNGFITGANAAQIKAGNFATEGALLTQRVLMLGEPNTANEPNITPDEHIQITGEKMIADLAGFGSLPHLMYKAMNKPKIEVYWAPQAYSIASPPTASTETITITGTAADNESLEVYINGALFRVGIVKGDTPTVINQKIRDAVNGVNTAPCILTDSTGDILATTKWKGKTSASMKFRFVRGENDINKMQVSFSSVIVAGTGTPDINPALDLMGSTWYTQVINPYGEDVFADLELFNGVPGGETGRWAPLVGLPFIAVFGSNISTVAGATGLTYVDARKSQATNVAGSAPNEEWFPGEIAALTVSKFAQISNTYPHMGMQGVALDRGATHKNAGEMNTSVGRNAIALKGHSTSELKGGQYVNTDFLTTFNDGEASPKWREARDVMVVMNILHLIKQLQAQFRGKVAAADDAPTAVENIIKAKTVKTEFIGLFENCVRSGLMAESATPIESLKVTLNPQYRFNVGFNFLITPEIKQTDVLAYFDFFTII